VSENQKEIKDEVELDSKELKKWDLSLVIAVSAVLISLVSAFIGFRESNIMSEKM